MEHAIVNNGFGGKVVRTELTLLIEHHVSGHDAEPFRVHLFHGTPAHPRWFESRPPIKCCRTIDEARQLVDTLGGLVDTHKHFPIVQTRW